MCITIFTVALFTKANIWKQPKCPSIDEWIKKIHIHSMEYYTQPLKGMKSCYFQQQGQMPHDLTYMWNLKNLKNNEQTK